MWLMKSVESKQVVKLKTSCKFRLYNLKLLQFTWKHLCKQNEIKLVNDITSPNNLFVNTTYQKSETSVTVM